MHDPDVYKDPMSFNPDRLIAQPDKSAEPDPFDLRLATVAGELYARTPAYAQIPNLLPPLRSACPGNQLAQSIMYIFAATVLPVFNIKKVVINGVVQEPKNEFSSGVLVYVLSFSDQYP